MHSALNSVFDAHPVYNVLVNPPIPSKTPLPYRQERFVGSKERKALKALTSRTFGLKARCFAFLSLHERPDGRVDFGSRPASTTRIAAELGTYPDHVRRCLVELEAEGFLKRVAITPRDVQIWMKS
jgi:hypothetical protein